MWFILLAACATRTGDTGGPTDSEPATFRSTVIECGDDVVRVDVGGAADRPVLAWHTQVTDDGTGPYIASRVLEGGNELQWHEETGTWVALARCDLTDSLLLIRITWID